MENEVLGLLHEVGYSKELSEKRAKIYENAGKGVTIFERRNFGGDFDIVIGGSRGDGTGVYLDCDVDKIFVQNEVKCFDEIGIDAIDASFKTVFRLETEGIPSGYAKLRLHSMQDGADTNQTGDILQHRIKQALTNVDGIQYLRNDHTLCSAIGPQPGQVSNSWLHQNIVYSKVKAGPSTPYNIRIPLLQTNLELDEALAFRCSCPAIVHQCCERVSGRQWPPTYIVQSVISQDAYVVPVGLKDHTDENLQWRICFTLTEIALVQSFNDTQIKLFAALKLVTKHCLKPICKNITTYIIKNILFWLMEESEHSHWEEKYFNERFTDALLYLKTSINNRELKNYMIPTRNLLLNKVSYEAML
ncbi:uncharacterized protein LOC132735871 [Ruditapes philippinarum]|uniref:uncharacterized protein LOC132735871 n=1 Tax=Ruditapes philippinarum TaxID=129788 RepID=UPI00295A79C9|nr:uncharacterized protein LOC132735871 [Ruditapes philippinarum]